MEQPVSYALYKGLQRPLVFKFFRGKFIYWALGSVVAGIVTGGAISAFISSVLGIIIMVFISVPLLFYTISKQKKGLYTKSKDHFIGIIQPNFTPIHATKKTI